MKCHHCIMYLLDLFQLIAQTSTAAYLVMDRIAWPVMKDSCCKKTDACVSDDWHICTIFHTGMSSWLNGWWDLLCWIYINWLMSFAVNIVYPRDGQYPHFYPYGEGAGDSLAPRSDDSYTSELNLPVPVNFFGRLQDSAWVSHVVKVGPVFALWVITLVQSCQMQVDPH